MEWLKLRQQWPEEQQELVAKTSDRPQFLCFEFIFPMFLRNGGGGKVNKMVISNEGGKGIAQW